MDKIFICLDGSIKTEDEIRKLDYLQDLRLQMTEKKMQMQKVRARKASQEQELQKYRQSMPDHNHVVKEAEKETDRLMEASKEKRVSRVRKRVMLILVGIFLLACIPYFVLTVISGMDYFAEKSPVASSLGLFLFTVPAIWGILSIARRYWARSMGWNWSGLFHWLMGTRISWMLLIAWCLSVYLLIGTSYRLEVLWTLYIMAGVLVAETIAISVIGKKSLRKSLKDYTQEEKHIYQRVYQQELAQLEAEYAGQVQAIEKQCQNVQADIQRTATMLTIGQIEHADLQKKWDSCDYMPDYYKQPEVIKQARKKLVSGEARFIIEALYQIEAEGMRRMQEELAAAQAELEKLKANRAADMQMLENEHAGRRIRDERLYNQTMETLRKDTDEDLVRAAELKEDTRKKKLNHGITTQNED